MKIKLWVKSGRNCSGSGFQPMSLQVKSVPTKRAPDAGAIPSIFLRLILFPVGRLRRPRPSVPRRGITQTVGQPRAKHERFE